MADVKAVLVIDMLYDFLYGKLACERCREIIPDFKSRKECLKLNKLNR